MQVISSVSHQAAMETHVMPLPLSSKVAPIHLKQRLQAQEEAAKPLRSAAPLDLPKNAPKQVTATGSSSLPVLPPPARRRQQSEPVPLSTSSMRRSIFGQFWRGRTSSICSESSTDGSSGNHDDPHSNTNNTMSTTPPRRARAVSLSALAETPEEARLCIDCFSPPVARSVIDNHEYFLPLDTLNETYTLPVLPMPLRRFFTNGKSSPLQGMYPLTSPKPILRKRFDNELAVNEDGDFDCNSNETNDPTTSLASWNLTSTSRGLPRCPTSFSETSSGSESNNNLSIHHNRRVSFDPRVTITEFEDLVPREWFSEVELERFRTQTVMRAQAYLMEHPEMIQVYQQAVLDPITNTMRKRALYSMPCLGPPSDSNSDNSLHESESKSMDNVINRAQHLMTQHAQEVAAQQHVQSILIVDRNKVVLDLFHRSLSHIFPHARIVLADSAQSALTIFRKELIEKKSGFDIVIAEERLNLPLSKTGTPLVTVGKFSQQRSNSMQEDDGDSSATLHVRRGSLTDIDGRQFASNGSMNGNSSAPTNPHQNMTGSELLSRISKEAKMLTVASPIGRNGTVRPISNPFTPLLVGVTFHPTADEHKFESADLVWGKPPPYMDTQLRNHIVSKLLSKRRAAKSKSSYQTS